MSNGNVDQSNLSKNRNMLPQPEMLERIIHEAVRTKYGAPYEELVLEGWNIISVDTNQLVMCTNSSFRCQIIRSRLFVDMERVTEDTCGIHPALSIILN